MTRALRAERVEAASGDIRSAVIFLHGYGANGADLIGLAEPLATVLPDTLFLAPDAPERCFGTPFGLQWFPIPWLDGSSELAAEEGLLRATEDLQAFLDGVMVAEDLLPEQVALVGFSQGTMMALHVGLRRRIAPAAIVGYSGIIAGAEHLGEEIQSAPPVLLVHGDQDEVIPAKALALTRDSLAAAQVVVEWHLRAGLGHGIDPVGLAMGGGFLRQAFGGHKPATKGQPGSPGSTVLPD